ncbi:DNA-binding protein [Massilia sp. erpn]|uniref:DNA-binding protein n=1 Tax=Massilia sp. erpn TaxID=2738142 RepID=UPI002105C60C|nr:DNA-binding protein [Massilia sp. erpn]UTY56542.1 hypothetical protein HPQ68_04710 [Massilia sp. erpn]
MASQELTFEQVAAAANGLESEGQQVTIEAVSGVLDAASPIAIHPHLRAWRASRAQPEAPKAELPPALLAALGNWALQYAEEAGASARDALAQSDSDLQALLESGQQSEAEREEAQAVVAARDEEVRRLTTELRDARQVASDALVGKAKDQLAIDGKDRQLNDLRAQIERNVAALAAESDARLAAEMELVGATTARDNFSAEVKALRAELDALHAERRPARA